MTDDAIATRRAFLKGGALLAAPLVAAAPAMASADGGAARRLARLEDEATIRGLHQAWLREARSGAAMLDEGMPRDGAIRGIAADEPGAMPEIAIAADGRHATGRLPCTVRIERARARDCTLAQMAVAQGGGVIRSAERGVLETTYRKTDGGWALAGTRLIPA